MRLPTWWIRAGNGTKTATPSQQEPVDMVHTAKKAELRRHLKLESWKRSSSRRSEGTKTWFLPSPTATSRTPDKRRSRIKMQINSRPEGRDTWPSTHILWVCHWIAQSANVVQLRTLSSPRAQVASTCREESRKFIRILIFWFSPRINFKATINSSSLQKEVDPKATASKTRLLMPTASRIRRTESLRGVWTLTGRSTITTFLRFAKLICVK